MSNNWTPQQYRDHQMREATKRRLSHEQRARETIQREGLPKAKFAESALNPVRDAKPAKARGRTGSATLPTGAKAHGARYSLPVVLAWFKEMGIPEPIPEYRFDPDRKWRFDFAFCPGSLISKVAVEVQGGLFSAGAHVRGAALLKEHEKLNAAAIAGWRVLFVTPDQLCLTETAEMIRKALEI